MRKVFRVKAVWDKEAGVFFSESDISGLHIEAGSLEEFEEIMLDVAPDLLIGNHVSPDDLKGPHPEDAIPTIFYELGHPLQVA